MNPPQKKTLKITDSLEKTLMLGKIEGRRRGRQRMRWLDHITESMDMSLISSYLNLLLGIQGRSWMLNETYFLYRRKRRQRSHTELFLLHILLVILKTAVIFMHNSDLSGKNESSKSLSHNFSKRGSVSLWLVIGL
ncbi:hypothetical protein AB1E19_015297 [Capra hircus]